MPYRRKKKLNHEQISEIHLQSVSQDRLEEALEFIDRLRKWRSKSKLYTTYVEGVRKALANTGNERIYCDFRLEGTATGRLSCGGYRAGDVPLGVSFHTLPRDKSDNIRDLITAIVDSYFGTPKAFIAADYGQMELRVMAHNSQDENLIAAFFSGEDLHKYTASLCFNKDINDVTEEERQIAKSVSFLVIYGGREYRLSKTANITLERAAEVIESYEQAFPSIFAWMDEVKQELKDLGYAETRFGRRRHLPNIFSNDPRSVARAERQGINFKIQSEASDILCYSLLDISKEFKLRALDAKPVATVHDSIEAVTSLDDLEEAVQIVYDKMMYYPTLKKLGFDLCVPMKVDVEVGTSFGDGMEVEINKAGTIMNLEDIMEAKFADI